MAAPDPFSNLPPEISAELLSLQRRRQLADMLAQQSFQPIQRAQSKSRYEVPMSPLQPIAQVLTGLTAKAKQEEGDKAMGELGNRYQAGVAKQLADYRTARAGPEFGATEQTPAQGPRAAIEKALSNKWIQSHPQVQFDMQRLAKDEDRGVITKEVRVGDGTMVQTMESMDNGRTWQPVGVPGPKFAKQVGPTVVNERQPTPPVAVMRRDGKGAEFVSREDAIGRIPAPMDVGLQSALAGGKAGATQSATQEVKRQFNMQGIGATIKEAEDLLTGASGKALPTGSGVGTAVDYLGGLVGASPSGAVEAQTLKAIGGALTAKMPRMEGPQSDKDTTLYREMAAAVGDSSLPRDRRIAALQKVKELWAKYERLNPGAFEPTPGGAPAASGGVVDFNALPP